jgi:hypothetical protein
MVAQLKPLQSDATSGAGRTLIVPEPERIVYFLIRVKGTPMGGEIQIECCPMNTSGSGTGSAQMIVWRPMGAPIPVPTDIFGVGQYYAGSVSGIFRARISKPITGGTVNVWPFVGNTEAASEPVVR